MSERCLTSRCTQPRSRAWLVAAVLLLLPALSQAQAVIKVNDNVNFKFGGLLQTWADAQQDATTGGYANNLFIRRIRFLVGGQIAPNITFFFETDNPNLGKNKGTPATNTLGSGFITQDAFVTWKPAGSNAFMLDTGLMLPPLCRNCLSSAATLLSLDYETFSFTESAATQSSVGRDTGIQARGYLGGGHLEYRGAALQGFRGAGSRNALRTVGRVQFNAFDTEVGGFFYPGFYMGNKKIWSVGTAYDQQQGYSAYSADTFLSLPDATKKNAFNGNLTFLLFDGGKTFTTSIPKQRDVSIEGGYYVGALKMQPFLRFEDQNFSASANDGKDNKRIQAGLSWLPNGHNFNIKGAYSRVDPRQGRTTNELTVQLQFFYY